MSSKPLSGKKQSFGLGLFFIGIIVTAGIVFLWKYQPAGFWSDLKDWLPFMGLGPAAVTLLVAYVSYPRVHNLQVQIFGFGTAVAGLGYFLLRIPHTSGWALPFPLESVQPLLPASVYTQLVFVALLSSVLPGFVKYRVTRRLTVLIAIVQVLLYGAVLATAEWMFDVGAAFILPVSIGVLVGVQRGFALVLTGLTVVTLVIAVTKERHTFGLGGLHSGAVFVAAAGWLMPVLQGDAHTLAELVYIGFALFATVGMVVHWFQRIENRAAYDPLLRIYNREYCTQVLSEQSRINSKPPFSIALCDLDHFKSVNDKHGHDAGDEVLVQVAQRIQQNVVPNGVVARYGGEELVVFLPQTDRTEARKILEQMRQEVEQHPVRHEGRTIPVTLSIGLSTRVRPDQSLEAILKTADKALYNAKSQGRNRIRSGTTK